MDIRAAEISRVIRDQIANFGVEAEMAEVGRVLSVGDGIARIYGLDEVESGEMVEFEDGTRGLALNLEADNVGVVVFGDDKNIHEGGTVKRTKAIVDVPVGKGLLGRVVDALGDPIDGKGSVQGSQRRNPGPSNQRGMYSVRGNGLVLRYIPSRRPSRARNAAALYSPAGSMS